MNEINTHIGLEQILFYSLEKAIKSYRKFAQKNIRKANINITIDQWLILKSLYDNPNINQREIAIKIFKDHASVTRMIELLVNKGLLNRSQRKDDRRRYKLTISLMGKSVYKDLIPIIAENRKKALKNLNPQDVEFLKNMLEIISHNCSAEVKVNVQNNTTI